MGRYFSALYTALESISKSVDLHGIILGPETNEAPKSVSVVSSRKTAALWRLPRLWMKVHQAMNETDVMVSHFCLNVVLPVLFKPGAVRLVCHFHGPWAAESRSAGAGRMTCLMKRLIETVVLRRADCVIVLSRSFAQLLTDQYGIDPAKIVLIAPGVDSDKFCADNRVETEPFVLCVRRLVPRMGVDILLRAWSEVHSNTRLVIAGDGAARASLQKLAVELGLTEHVSFLGRVTDEQLAKLYASAILTVVPTLDLEGFGLVVLESLASGTPVVATAVQGLEEVLKPFSPELLVMPGVEVELREVLSQALGAPEELPSRNECREYAMRYSWHNAAKLAVAQYLTGAKCY